MPFNEHTTPYPEDGSMIEDYQYSEPIAFEPKYGHLVSGQFPADCIDACSASGSVDEAVEYWVSKLNLSSTLEPVRSRVESYLKEFGAWDDLQEADIDTLANRVLWVACCDIREQGEWFGLSH